jgi:hypothetical protein
MFRVDYLVFTEEKWISDIGLPRHLDFPHVWTDVSSRFGLSLIFCCSWRIVLFNALEKIIASYVEFRRQI